MGTAPHADCCCFTGVTDCTLQPGLFEDRPDQWFEEDQQGLDEHGGMDDIQGLDVLLVPANKK